MSLGNAVGIGKVSVSRLPYAGNGKLDAGESAVKLVLLALGHAAVPKLKALDLVLKLLHGLPECFPSLVKDDFDFQGIRFRLAQKLLVERAVRGMDSRLERLGGHQDRIGIGRNHGHGVRETPDIEIGLNGNGELDYNKKQKAADDNPNYRHVAYSFQYFLENSYHKP